MKIILTLAVATALLIVCADPAHACDRGSDRGDRFAQYDTNGDGKITRDEVSHSLWERLSKADANGDGGVTLEELRAHRKERGGNRASA